MIDYGLTDEGEKVVAEANRRFTKKLLVLASFFGVANAGALIAIFLGVQSTAQATVSARMQEQIQGSVDVLQQVVSEALTELGDAREQVGAVRASLQSTEIRVNNLAEALAEIGPEEQKLTLAANILSALGTSGGVDDLVLRLDGLEKAISAVNFQEPESYGAGWSRYPSDQYDRFSFGKTADGFIHLSGLMSGCPDPNSPIFTLPLGYRPETRQILTAIASNNTSARVDVLPDGTVIFMHSQQQTAEQCLQQKQSGRWLSLHKAQFHVSN